MTRDSGLSSLNRQRASTAGLYLIAALAASGCAEPAASVHASLIQLNLTGSDTLRSRGEERVLEAALSDDAGRDQPQTFVEFSVDKPDVLSISRVNERTVILRALADGEAKVTAAAGDARATRDLLVRRRAANLRLSVLGIPDAASLSVGGIVALDAIVLDSLGYTMIPPGEITLTTGNSSVAYLNSHNLVTALGGGRTAVTGHLTVAESVLGSVGRQRLIFSSTWRSCPRKCSRVSSRQCAYLSGAIRHLAVPIRPGA